MIINRQRRKQEDGKKAFELIEEVFQLLKNTPLRAMAFYYIGTLPFILALLYFWADMSKSAFAYSYVKDNALLLTFLFIWMKTWQSVFSRELLCVVQDRPPEKWGLLRLFRISVKQAAVQPYGLVLLPVSIFIMVPLGHVHALYQNMTVMDDGRDFDVSSLFSKSWGQAKLWPKQNFKLIWALSPFLLVTATGFFLVIIPVMKEISPDWTSTLVMMYSVVFGMALLPLSPFGTVVAVNIGMLIVMVPMFLNMLFGIQTIFVISPDALYNSTFFAVVCGLTYLCMDPLVKAAYALRCFYGQSIETGEDLKAELAGFIDKKKAAAIIILMASCILFSNSANAQEDAGPGKTISKPSSSSNGVVPNDLDIAIDKELENRQYAWRMPRPPRPESEGGILTSFFEAISGTLESIYDSIKGFLKKIKKSVKDLFPDFEPRQNQPTNFSGISQVMKALLYVVIAVLIGVVLFMLFRIWQRRDKTDDDFVDGAPDTVPDLEDEATTANELPESEWIALARELIAKGEYRLAMRAVFLANLANLADKELIHINRAKSNRDYKHELSLRAHAYPGAMKVFGESVNIYESVWYGMHESTSRLVNIVMQNQERLGTIGQTE